MTLIGGIKRWITLSFQAYELAKKRGYLVCQARTRHYPLSNTFRNYCDAVGWPCLRVDQASNESLDTVVIDLTTLRIASSELVRLKAQICQAVESKCGLGRKYDNLSILPAKAVQEQVGHSNEGILTGDQSLQASSRVTVEGLLHFCAPRPLARRVCQVAQDCCKSFESAIKKPLP